MKLEFEITRLKAELLPDLYNLFKQAGKKKSLNQIKRKYNTQEFGEAYVGFLAYDKIKNLPVAYYGVIPVQAKLADEIILVAQSADTLTHPEYRKLGLFTMLANKTYELCEQLNIKYLFGIPNYNSFSGFVNKLDWKNPAYFTVYSKKVYTIPLNKLIQKTLITQSLYARYLKFVITFLRIKTDLNLENQTTKSGFFISRNVDYFNYKLSPFHFKLKLHNIIFLVSFNRFLKIGCYASNDKKNFERAIKKLYLLAFITGCHKINFQNLNTENDAFFDSENLGFTKNKGLPYIIKPISKKLENQFLKIDYFDFDTF